VRIRYALLCLVVASLLLTLSDRVTGAASAPTIGWKVISSGGGHAEVAAYRLDGSIGQPVVGRRTSESSELCSGFWCRVATGFRVLPVHLYVPVVTRN
jgi:hypothetical protein